MEQLYEFLWPRKGEDGVSVFSAPVADGAVPFIHLDDIGKYVRWIFTHPAESKGLDLKVATEHVGWEYLAKTFTDVTGQPARYEPVGVDEYFKTGPLAPAANITLGPKGLDDDTLLTFKENFSAWWRLYQRSADNKGLITRDYEFLDKVLPDRVKSLAEWMRKTGYSGERKQVLKSTNIPDPHRLGTE